MNKTQNVQTIPFTDGTPRCTTCHRAAHRPGSWQGHWFTRDELTAGTVVRFQNTLLSGQKLTVRLSRDADVAPVDGPDSSVYAVFFGRRVRPADTSVSFGHHKVYCVNIDRIEIVKGA